MDELVQKISDLMYKKEGEEDEIGFLTKLRKTKQFDKEKLNAVNENLIKYRELHKKDLLIEKFFMDLFFGFRFSYKHEIGYYKKLRDGESVDDIADELEALNETHDIMCSIVKGYHGCVLAERLVELLWKSDSGDEDGYLVKLKAGRELDKNQANEILNVLEEYRKVFDDSKYVEKPFVYAFMDFYEIIRDNEEPYRRKNLSDIITFERYAELEIHRLLSENWIVK